MIVATFDTLKFANTLKAAGVPDKQAEAQAVAFAEMVQVNFKELATKEDLGLLKTDLDRLGEELREKLERLNKHTNDNLERVGSDARNDLDRAVGELKRDIAELRTELKHDLQTMLSKHQADSLLLKWMLGATFTGVIAGIGLLARLLFTQGR